MRFASSKEAHTTSSEKHVQFLAFWHSQPGLRLEAGAQNYPTEAEVHPWKHIFVLCITTL